MLSPVSYRNFEKYSLSAPLYCLIYLLKNLILLPKFLLSKFSTKVMVQGYKCATVRWLWALGNPGLAADWEAATIVFPIPYAIFFQMMCDTHKKHMSAIFSKNELRLFFSPETSKTAMLSSTTQYAMSRKLNGIQCNVKIFLPTMLYVSRKSREREEKNGNN